jgi:hypothetical protein
MAEYRSRYERAGTDYQSRYEAKKRSGKPTLSYEVSKLEKAAEESGATEIEQESPGAFRRIVDLLSRGNYASAGIVEEMAAGRPQDAFARAGREIFSGVGGLQGEKRGFGEVLERSGVPELGSVNIPLPKFGAVAALGLPSPEVNVTGRGTLGLALDIALDPITYMTAGTGKAIQVGGKALSKSGARALAKGVAEALPEVRELPKLGALKAPLSTEAKALGRSGAGTYLDLLHAPAETKMAAREVATEYASKLAVKSVVDDVADDLLKSGIEVGSELYGKVQRQAVKMAEERILTAAATNPKMLDRGGLKFLGRTVPGTPEIATAASGVSRKVVEAVGSALPLEATRQMKKSFDAVGKVFNRDWLVRNLPDYLVVKQAHLDTHALMTAKIHQRIADSAVARMPRPTLGVIGRGKAEASWKRMIDAVERGDFEQTLKGVELDAARDFRQMLDEWAVEEGQLGMLQGSRPNYAPHFYKNDPEDMASAVAAFKGKQLNLATIGRHAEERAFNTLQEAVDVTSRGSKIRADIKPLVPVYDPVEILRRRGEAHADAIAFNDFYATVRTEYGRDLPYNADDFFDIARPAAQLPTAQSKIVGDAVTAGKTPVQAFRAWAQPMRKEFLRQRLGRVKSPQEMTAVLNKYGLDDLPRLKRLAGTVSEDGSRYVSINIPFLADMELPKSIADDIAEMSERVLKAREVSTLVRGFDKLNNLFKSSVTVPFPSFHFRNAYSNVAQSFLDIGLGAIDPRQHLNTVRVLGGAEGLLRTKAGTAYSFDQVREMLDRFQIKVSSRQQLELTGEAGIPRRGLRAVLRAPGAVGAGIETEARAQLFLNYLRRGISPEQAAARTKQFLFDYSNLSRTEKELFKRVIPFYTWTRKNIALQLRTLRTAPGRLATEIKPFRGREEENGQMTSWEGSAFKLRLGRDGKTLRVLTGIDLPMRNLDLLWNGTLRGTGRQTLGQVTPILKSLPEFALGVQAFTGRELSRKESTAVGKLIESLDPPQGVKNFLGYKKETDAAGRDRYTFNGERFYALFQSWILSRVVSTSDRQFKTFSLDPNWTAVMLDTLTGLRLKNLNLDEEQQKRLQERRRQLERSLVLRGERKEFRRVYEPKP